MAIVLQTRRSGIIKYEGELDENNRQTGNGRTEYANGDVYEGEYVNGKRHGIGVYRFASGALYNGNWFEGRKHGNGLFVYRDGSTYNGDWKNDVRCGNGEYFYINGDRYVGQWDGHVREGRGVYTYSGIKLRFDGEWTNDRRAGEGTVTRLEEAETPATSPEEEGPETLQLDMTPEPQLDESPSDKGEDPLADESLIEHVAEEAPISASEAEVEPQTDGEEPSTGELLAEQPQTDNDTEVEEETEENAEEAP